MSSYVLDASALLTLLKNEAGSELVATMLEEGAIMSSVNLSEVVTKLTANGIPEDLIRTLLNALKIGIVDFDTHFAYETGLLFPLTKSAGLSLGDRACLALAKHLKLPAVTADRVWEKLSLDVTVHLIRGSAPGK